tara:strand:+ start:457 stop:1359 length:903 start_codon:yes stop_codon:yes gene_type:complete
MKIDKVIFSTSEEYSKFWNIQSKIYKEVLDIEPICILYGEKKNTDMTEEYGKVIERDFDPTLPKVLQITWSKFDFTKSEPDTVWMIGDIDMIPLHKEYFTSNIGSAPEDAYLHLNYSAISVVRRGILDGFMKEGPAVLRRIRHGCHDSGADLPAHYHISKGSNFNKVYELDRSFNEQISHIVDSGIYGHGAHCQPPWPKPSQDELMNFESFYWLAEENYSSVMLYNACVANTIQFIGYHYDNRVNRIDRSVWSEEKNDYVYDINLLKQKQIVDLHCHRPFDEQKDQMYRIIDESEIFSSE